jgi:hypothetical protein
LQYFTIRLILNSYVAERVSYTYIHCDTRNRAAGKLIIQQSKKKFLLRNSNFRHCLHKITPNVPIMNDTIIHIVSATRLS